VKLLRLLGRRLSSWLIADGCEEIDGFHYCRDCELWRGGRCCLERVSPAIPSPGLPWNRADEGF
jgi:hypothetical protein